MARPLLVYARVACTADRGQGATVLSPLSASPAGVRVSVTFSSRRPAKRLFVCRLRRCKTAAVPEDLLSRVDVLSGTACATVLSACRFFVAAPGLTIRCSSVSPGDPEPPVEWALARLTPTHQGRHAQGRRRFCTAFAVPVASSSAFEIVSSSAP